jgi:hypothetical protein
MVLFTGNCLPLSCLSKRSSHEGVAIFARTKRKIWFEVKERAEIADLCAYPLARNTLNPEEPYVPFDIIKNKIYTNDKGEYVGWGLKVFP